MMDAEKRGTNRSWPTIKYFPNIFMDKLSKNKKTNGQGREQ